MSENIVIKNLNQFYGKKQVLYDVNVTIEKGMFGLLGRNGAGKTTLMKTLATLLPVKEGEVSICGIPLEKGSEIRPLIGYLPQDFTMYQTMTVREAMDYLGVLSGIKKEERKVKIEELLKKVNLSEHAAKKVKALSGGMKRRLGIAQALLHDPKVLIVDEPTAGLDPEERIRFRNLLSEVADKRIVILSTHIVGDIEASCEKLAILNEGHLLYLGTVENLLISAKDKVYTIAIPKNEMIEFKNNHTVISMQTRAEGDCVRFLSEHPLAGADLCEPNIEDAYMLCLKRHGVKADL